MTPEPPDLPSPSVSVTTTLAADAAGAEVASPGAHAHSAGNTHCLNCGTKLTGPFCSACGQHDFDFHRSFRHVFMEALENIFHFDGKFFRNLVTLLFRPGRLTADFNAGKRASQVPPFRLYIFTAFVFFLLLLATSDLRPPALGMSPGTGAAVTVDGKPASLTEALNELRDDAVANTRRGDAKTTDAATPPAAQEIKQAAEKYRDEMLERRKAKEAAEKNSAQPVRNDLERWAETQGRRAMDPQFRYEMGQRFLTAIPKMLLFCLPAFALFTRVLFRKSGQVYLQHLVLALHYHTFIFIFLLFRDGWMFLADAVGFVSLRGWLLFAANVWLAVYPVLMLRKLFGNSWPKTIFKTLILSLAYCLLLALAFALTAVVLFLMI